MRSLYTLALLSVLGIGQTDSSPDNKGSEIISQNPGIRKPDVVVIPRDKDDNGYIDKLIDDPLSRDPIQPFDDLGFVRSYSVYNENSRVIRFESLERDVELYGGKPDINDWVGNDFDGSKILFFFQGTRRPYFVEENGEKKELRNWRERMDCPICESGKVWYADIIKDLRNEYGGEVGGAIMVVGKNSLSESPNRLLTKFSGKGVHPYSVPQVGIAYRSENGWEIDSNYTMSWNDFNNNWWNNSEFFDEVLEKAGINTER